MAPSISSCRMSWQGPPTIPQLTANLFKRQRTILSLPISYHPALSARLYPSSRVRKSIDLIGDARLLSRIAEIEGLEELARLVTTMQMVSARLRLRSPAPHLVFNIPAMPRAARFRELQHGEPWTATDDAKLCGSCGVLHTVKTSKEQLC
jgi:hypothetical protein